MKTITLGKLTEIMQQESRILRTLGMELAVFRLATGEIRLIENECPLGGGKLSNGMVSGRYVYSPLYDYRVSLDDGRMDVSPVRKLRIFETVADRVSGMLLLQLEEAEVTPAYGARDKAGKKRVGLAS
jgi:nitrite reductase (NADH) small subunit